jgi:hypothetical protein
MHDFSALKDSSMALSSIPYHQQEQEQEQEQEQTDRRKKKIVAVQDTNIIWYGNKNTKH